MFPAGSSSIEQSWIGLYVFDPKLLHDPLHVIRAKRYSHWMFVAELSHTSDPRIRSAGVWNKGRISRLMNDAPRATRRAKPATCVIGSTSVRHCCVGEKHRQARLRGIKRLVPFGQAVDQMMNYRCHLDQKPPALEANNSTDSLISR